ncbi:hypothetical protein GQ42DRAFT_165835 [Ramicandelaber brevisporus]|nr:hypothetical protein GQ42DRAFT_165835 [Ramicandelaber brevisporus]
MNLSFIKSYCSIASRILPPSRSSQPRYLSMSALKSYGRNPWTGRPMVVELTSKEREIFDLLESAAVDISSLRRSKALASQQNVESAEGVDLEGATILRVSGGWVRDKLLGRDSKDIDIAINNMTGNEFCEFLQSKGLAGKVGKILARPEQSKHLETATTKVLGVEIDFTNLRAETYAADSRIPCKMSFGTPVQDALRRDATINALFYNLHTQEVEDLTGRGIDDLEARVIRTPLSPHETFLDDPLRVLRLVRFASRYEFELDNDAKLAMAHPAIREAIKSKISRERIAAELDKMLLSKHPLHAVETISSVGIFTDVFVAPDDSITAPLGYSIIGDAGPESLATATARRLADVLDDPAYAVFENGNKLQVTDDLIRQMYIAAALSPYANLVIKDVAIPGAVAPKQKVAAKHGPALSYILRHSFKSSNNDTQVIPQLHSFQSAIHSAMASVESIPENVSEQRSIVGTMIRKLGKQWPAYILFALTMDLARNSPEADSTAIERYKGLVALINRLNLGDCYSLKPLVNGSDIANILEIKRDGRLGHLVELMIKYQLVNPDANADQCRQHLVANRDTLLAMADQLLTGNNSGNI